MTFFDEFKKTASSAADKAVKKTNDLTNIAKITLKIKNLEAQLDMIYGEIGRLFYEAERSGADATANIATNIIRADELKAEIAAYKKKLSSLRKMVICEGCENEISSTAAFCSYCGMKQVKPGPEEEEDEEDIVEETLDEIEDNSAE